MEIIGYHIVKNENAELLSNEIEKCLRDGWQPHGPLVTESRESVIMFIQPMIKVVNEGR